MIKNLTEKQRQLIGAMVGLARATDGNFDKLTSYTPLLIIEGLSALQENCEDRTESAICKIKEEKHRIVPDCSTCQSPCGRTFDYDFALLKNDEPSVVTLKDILLCLVTALGYFSSLVDGDRYTPDETILYKSVFFIGIKDAEPDFILPVIFECAQEVDKAMAACFDMSEDNIYSRLCTQEYVSVTGRMLENKPQNYYGALALASQKGEMANFTFSWNDPLQVALAFAIGEMSVSCRVNMQNSCENDIDESVAAYLSNNYKVFSL